MNICLFMNDSCWDTFDDVSSSYYNNWSTASTAIATADYYGTHTGQGVGSTTSYTWGNLQAPSTRAPCLINRFQRSGGDNVNSLTPVQHTYPGNPLPQPCWISQFFDHVTNGKVHRAQDVDNAKSDNSGGIATANGTPVYAAEAGTVDSIGTGNPPAAQSYPTCAGRTPAWPANYVKIKGSDGYFTVYVHVNPSVNVGDPINQGQQIGMTDNSGCQSGGHIHMIRRDPNGTPVNFTIPCVNPQPTNSLYDGVVNDDDDPNNP